MLENEWLESERHLPVKRQTILANDASAKALERRIVKRIDNLMYRLDRLQKLGE